MIKEYCTLYSSFLFLTDYISGFHEIIQILGTMYIYSFSFNIYKCILILWIDWFYSLMHKWNRKWMICYLEILKVSIWNSIFFLWNKTSNFKLHLMNEVKIHLDTIKNHMKIVLFSNIWKIHCLKKLIIFKWDIVNIFCFKTIFFFQIIDRQQRFCLLIHFLII